MGLFGFGKKEKDKMKDGLEKTRTGFWGNILNTLTGSKIDDDLYDSLEEQLILADVGGEVAIKLVDKLRDRVNAQIVACRIFLNISIAVCKIVPAVTVFTVGDFRQTAKF